jgi:hypothetical protein
VIQNAAEHGQSMSQHDIIERLARLEARDERRRDDIIALKEEVAKLNATVGEVRDLLQQAKGARWIVGTLLAAGPIIGAMSAKLMPLWPPPGK